MGLLLINKAPPTLNDITFLFFKSVNRIYAELGHFLK